MTLWRPHLRRRAREEPWALSLRLRHRHIHMTLWGANTNTIRRQVREEPALRDRHILMITYDFMRRQHHKLTSPRGACLERYTHAYDFMFMMRQHHKEMSPRGALRDRHIHMTLWGANTNMAHGWPNFRRWFHFWTRHSAILSNLTLKSRRPSLMHFSPNSKYCHEVFIVMVMT
jgi:hypothetical protein